MKSLPSNPYIVGNPIKSREMFFGREDDFHFVSRKIGKNRSNQIVVLCGDRRSGKTSILFQILGGRLGSSFLPILIDMQMLAGVRGDLEFYKAILKSGYAALQSSGFNVDLEKAVNVELNPGQLMESFLSWVRDNTTGKVVLFLLDEYELIEEKIKRGTLSETTVHHFAGVLESDYRVSFVFTGSKNIEERNPEIWRTLLGKSVYRKISYLSRQDTARLITEPVQESVKYPQEVVAEIYRLTGGQPFYTQVICQNLIDLLIDEELVTCTSEDLGSVIREIVANPMPQMIYSWNSFSPWERIMLSSLAGKLETNSAWANGRQVVRYILDARIILPFNKEKATVLLEEDYHKEFIEKNDAGAYRFRMDVFRHWIRREHSIWKVVKEADMDFRTTSRAIVLPASIVGGVIAVLVVAWFLLVPWFLPGLADWGRNIGLLPEEVVNESAGESDSKFVRNVSFKSNRGPFTLVIDNMHTIRSADSRLGSMWIMLESITAGEHDFTASLDNGQSVKVLNIIVSPSVNSFAFYFPPIDSTTLTESTDPTALSEEAVLTSDTQAKDLSTLIIQSNPPGASVMVANAKRGITPLEVDIAPGHHPIYLLLDGYKPVYLDLEIESGKVHRENVTMEEGWTVLSFAIQQSASVYLDGDHFIDLPTTKTIPVRSGRHVLRIVYPARHSSRELELDLIAGDVFTVKESTR